MPARRRPASARSLKPTSTGLPHVDAVAINESPTLGDYLSAVSEYVVQASSLTAEQAKQAQIALSGALGRALREELVAKLPRIRPYAGELDVAGALRTARADVSEAHPLDGLRLAIEIKPVNLAVGRALWNRFGDVRAFAVNIHLKFPFAVVGGVLVVPTWEWAKVTKAMLKEQGSEQATRPDNLFLDERLDFDLADADQHPGIESEAVDDVDETSEATSLAATTAGSLYRKSTKHLLERLVRRLQRTRRRETEADAAHLLEAVAVIVYNPDSAELDPDLPARGSGLRWDEFIDSLVDTYDVRFED